MKSSTRTTRLTPTNKPFVGPAPLKKGLRACYKGGVELILLLIEWEFLRLGVLFVGVIIFRALLSRVYTRAP